MLASRYIARLARPSTQEALGALTRRGTVLSLRTTTEQQKRTTWYSSPDVKGEKEGTASSIFYPFLIALGIIGGGVALYQYDKKRQLQNALKRNLEVVTKCEECQREIPRNSKMVEEGIEKWAFCPHCKKMCFVFEQSRVPQCRECDTLVLSGKYSTNLQNDVYCNKHTKLPHRTCFFCSRNIYIDKPDKPSSRIRIHSCNACRGVKMNRKDIPQAMAHVKQELKEGYGIDFPDNVNFYVKMVKRMPPEIKLTSGIPGEHRSIVGRTTSRMTSVFNPFKKNNSWTGDVIILEGFDTVGFEQVLAHEMGHVYIKSNKIRFPPEIEEGLCNLLSYLYMRQICKKADTPQPQLRYYMRKMEKDVDEVYGDGFRKVFNIYFNIRNKTNAEVNFSQFLEILHSSYGTRMNSFSYPPARTPRVNA